jgi:hypothetical protein
VTDTPPIEEVTPEDPEITALKAEYDAIYHKNLGMERRLKAYGRALRDDHVFINRMNLIVDVLLPPGSADRLRMEIAFQAMCQGALDEALNVAVAEGKAAEKSLIKPRGGLVIPR